MNTRSIGFRLTSYYAILVGGVLIVLGIALVLSVRILLIRNLSDALVRRNELTSKNLVQDIDTTGVEFVGREIHSRYSPEITGRFVRLSDDQGHVLYISGPPNDRSFDPDAVPASPFGAEERIQVLRQRVGGIFILVASPVTTRQGHRFLLESGASLGPAQSLLNHLIWSLVIGVPILLGVAIGGGFVLVRKSLAHVEKISRSAEAITFQNLSQRLPVARTGDELERLSLSLNRMIERLDESFQHTRKFSADASHELRTPLTVIRSELETIMQSEGAPTRFKETVGSVLEEVERLTKTVEGLLALARLDAGKARTEWVKLDLVELVSLVADQMSLLADDKQLEIRCHAAGPVFVHGDRARLKQVIVNLLDNAIQYTPQGGGIDLRVSRQNGAAILEVIDTGIGIPESALPHVFNRFYRVDQARSRNVGGAGIGLSIVKSIIAAHDGKIDITSQEGFGTTVRIELARTAVPEPTTENTPGGAPASKPA